MRRETLVGVPVTEGRVKALEHELAVERQHVADMEQAYRERQRVENGQIRQNLERTVGYAAESIGTASFCDHMQGMQELLLEAAALARRVAEMKGRKGLAQAKRDAEAMRERLEGTERRLDAIALSTAPMLPMLRKQLALPEKT